MRALLLAAVLMTAPTLFAQTTVCNDEVMDILSGDIVTSDIEFEDGLLIEDVNVEVEVTHPFIGDLGVSIEGPEGSVVVLFSGVDASSDAQVESDLLVTFDDEGDARETDWTCECAAAPLESLGDFVGANSEGTWQLSIEDYFTPDDGTLDEWCLEVTGCGDVLQIGELVCAIVDDKVELNWTGEGYEEFKIHKNGEGIDTLDGSENEYTDELDLGVSLYQIIAVDEDDDCETLSTYCIIEHGLVEDCRELSDFIVGDDVDTVYYSFTNGVQNVVDDFADLGVSIEMSLMVYGTEAYAFSLENPSGDQITFHDHEESELENIDRSYADNGIPVEQVTLDCGCVTRTSGPGLFEDLITTAGESGVWTLSVEVDGPATGILDRWCVKIYGDGDPDPDDPEEGDFIRGDADNNGVVFPILDALYILEDLFGDGPEAECEDAADVDDTGSVSIIDALSILLYGFDNGPEPPAPFPDCGPDEEPDDINCDTISDECA